MRVYYNTLIWHIRMNYGRSRWKYITLHVTQYRDRSGLIDVWWRGTSDQNLLHAHFRLPGVAAAKINWNTEVWIFTLNQICFFWYLMCLAFHRACQMCHPIKIRFTSKTPYSGQLCRVFIWRTKPKSPRQLTAVFISYDVPSVETCIYI